MNMEIYFYTVIQYYLANLFSFHFSILCQNRNPEMYISTYLAFCYSLQSNHNILNSFYIVNSFLFSHPLQGVHCLTPV